MRVKRFLTEEMRITWSQSVYYLCSRAITEAGHLIASELAAELIAH